MDKNNGCLGYKPGSHKLGLQQHQPTNTLGFSQVFKIYNLLMGIVMMIQVQTMVFLLLFPPPSKDDVKKTLSWIQASLVTVDDQLVFC